MMSKKSPLLLLVALVASLMVSCGSMKNTSTVHRTSKVGGGRGDTRNFEIPSTLPPQSNALLAEAKKWIGTPYKYGGEDKRGIDCSGLVLNVYKSALDIKLPRNSGEQAKYCSPLQKNQLMPGDLIFFATGSSKKKVSHVGIYVGDGRMVHSSASSGVVVSDIESDYFVRTYAGAGSVDKYRAMISKSAQKSPAKKAASSSLAATSKTNSPAPASSPSTSPVATATSTQSVSASTGTGEQPYKMTPVTSLPKKVDRKEKTANKASIDTKNTPTPEKTEDAPAIGMPTVKSTQTTPTVTATPITTNANGQNAVKTVASETKKETIVTASSTPAQTKSEATAAKPGKAVVKTDNPVQSATSVTVKAEKAPANPVKAVQTVSTGKNAEPTPDEARKSVLSSLKEQKMDTINKK